MGRRGEKRRRSKSRDREGDSTTSGFQESGQDSQKNQDSPASARIQTAFIAAPSATIKEDGGDDSSLKYRAFPPPILSSEAGIVDKRIKDVLVIWKTYLESTQKKRKNPMDERCNFRPSLIQQHLWSVLLNTSWNAIGIAPTSSGKTLSYAIPTLVGSCNDKNNNNHGKISSVVVLVPTKELVHQVAFVYQKLIKILIDTSRDIASTTKNEFETSNRVVVPVYGGVDRKDQVRVIEDARRTSRPLVIVATPGRLLDILEQQEKQDAIKQSRAGGRSRDMVFEAGRPHWIVLDEADQLTKDGDLGPQVHNILTRLTETKMESPCDTSRLVFVSATMSSKARKKFEEWMKCDYALLVQLDNGETSPNINVTTNNGVSKDFHIASSQPNPVNVSNRNSLLFSRIPCHLKQVVHVCSEHKKSRKLVHVLQTIRNQGDGPNTVRNGRKGIIFFSKIDKLEYSCKLLRRERMHCIPLHGQLPTTIRQKHLHSFASAGRMPGGEMPLTLLLATDVAARGIDIPGIDFVIQYDFPGNLEHYVHRCGRAGRSSTEATGEVAASDSVSRSKEFTVYSFFTRNLQSMAGDLVRLLETHGAWVDPNLRALVQSTASAIAGKKQLFQASKQRHGINNGFGFYRSQ
jgi:superfamily II DNA/RNA helicase